MEKEMAAATATPPISSFLMGEPVAPPGRFAPVVGAHMSLRIYSVSTWHGIVRWVSQGAPGAAGQVPNTRWCITRAISYSVTAAQGGK